MIQLKDRGERDGLQSYLSGIACNGIWPDYSNVIEKALEKNGTVKKLISADKEY